MIYFILCNILFSVNSVTSVAIPFGSKQYSAYRLLGELSIVRFGELHLDLQAAYL